MFAPDRHYLYVGSMVAIPLGLVLCALILSPDDLGLRAGQLAGLKGSGPAERGRRDRLDREREAIGRRHEAKDGLARELAEGRLTLLEAAARARDMDREDPDFPWDGFRAEGPGASDDERHCLEVIAHLRTSLPLGPAPSEELARRLEEELRRHREGGTLRLPVAPSGG